MSKHPTPKEKAKAAEDRADAADKKNEAHNHDPASGDETEGKGGKLGDAQREAMTEAQTTGTAPSNPLPPGSEGGGLNPTGGVGLSPSAGGPSIGETVAGLDKQPLDPNAPKPGENISSIIPNAPVPRLSPQAAYPGEETITMISPAEFKVQHAPGMFAHFKKGPQEVPTSLQSHPYVLANGVKPYTKA